MKSIQIERLGARNFSRTTTRASARTMPTRKHFSASQKAQIALEILKEEKKASQFIPRGCLFAFRLE
jgi:phosphopentomutase